MRRKSFPISLLRLALKMILQKNTLVIAGMLLLLPLAYRCKDPYNPPVTQTNFGYLVVEGLLNDSSGTTSVLLSRTSTIAKATGTIAESGATVVVEDDAGSTYTLTESDRGSYSADKLMIDVTRTFRLKIRTADSKEYASDFVPFMKTPLIDSVNYTLDETDLHLYVNTHDPSNSTRYYRWNYVGTWAYHSAFFSRLKFVDGKVVQRDLNDDTYHCWKTVPSSQIMVGSTLRLADDIISNYELLKEPIAGEKLQYEYSVLVEQYALTREAYDYWQELKKNTENLGTLFGPQPSTVASNMHGLTKPDEVVVGYFSASSREQVRKTISSLELPPVHVHTTGYEGCLADTLLLNQVGNFLGQEELVHELYRNNQLIGYSIAVETCVDCTLHGGTNVKPSFWK